MRRDRRGTMPSRGEGNTGGGAMLFDAYIIVDWSGRRVPSPAKPSADAIWIGEYAHDGTVPREIYCRTRQEAFDRLLASLRYHVTAAHRVLIGLDFPYGYPAGLARALGLAAGRPAWAAIWSELAALIGDGPDNENNRFAVVTGLNARIGAGTPGPFWGGADLGLLRRTSPGFPYAADGAALERLRLTDRRLKGVQEVWKLFGAGSVGSQALLGIPRVNALRRHPELREISRVWPFETGFTPTPTPGTGPFILHAEIWPGVVDKAIVAAEIGRDRLIRDQAQVRMMCRWAARLDAAAELGARFDTPAEVEATRSRRVIEEEGWILGAR